MLLRQSKYTRRMKTLLLSLALTSTLFAGDKTPDYPSFRATASQELHAKMGIRAPELDEMYEAIRIRPGQDLSKIVPKEACGFFVKNWADGDERTEMVRCIRYNGTGALTDRLYAQLQEVRDRITKTVPNSYEDSRRQQQNLALIYYFEDLVRSWKVKQGQPAAWYFRGKGFSRELTTTQAYPFEQGDLVFSFGTSSISSTITQTTEPVSRFAHAFLIKKTGDKVTTLESLIETGVKEFPKKHFDSYDFNAVTVAKLKTDANPDDNKKRLDNIVACGAKKAGTPYDADMVVQDHGRIFCAELLIACYNESMGYQFGRDDSKIFAAFPARSKVRDQNNTGNVFNYINKLGVNAKEYIAPGDILKSPQVIPYAEYRNTKNLITAWTLYLMGQHFMDYLERGYKIELNEVVKVKIGFANAISKLAKIVTFGEYHMIPESFKNADVLGYLYVMQKKVFDVAQEDVGNYLKAQNTASSQTLLDANLVDLYAQLKYSIETNKTIRSNFKP